MKFLWRGILLYHCLVLLQFLGGVAANYSYNLSWVDDLGKDSEYYQADTDSRHVFLQENLYEISEGPIVPPLPQFFDHKNPYSYFHPGDSETDYFKYQFLIEPGNSQRKLLFPFHSDL